jgi:hypothetical protein
MLSSRTSASIARQFAAMWRSAAAIREVILVRLALALIPSLQAHQRFSVGLGVPSAQARSSVKPAMHQALSILLKLIS